MNRNETEIYIHIPFCVKKCRYCDFLSFKGSDDLINSYVKSLLSEIEAYSSALKGKHIRSVFIGGGTPTIISAENIEQILNKVFSCFFVEKEAEITIECNPGTADFNKLKAIRSSGVNRLSIGAQSFDNTYLKLLGRIHKSIDVFECFNNAKKAGFDNINIDLISALPGDGNNVCPQDINKWKSDLETAAGLGCTHISAYSLILEENTPLYDNASKLSFPDEDTEREIYYITEDVLSSYGFHKYEISNYAKKNKECLHNKGYWTGVYYYGFGLGAASYYNGMRFKNTSSILSYLSGEWLDKDETTVLDKKDKMSEFIILGLRLTDGISLNEFKNRFLVSLMDIYGETVDKYEKMGFLIHEEDKIRFSKEGVSVSNTILSDFI